MRKIIVVLLLAFATGPVLAKDVEMQQICRTAPGVPSPCQKQFESIAQDLVAAIDYKAVGPAEATGIVGFGLGVVLTYVPVDVEQDWKTATGTDFSGLGMAGLQVTKGLPLNLDLGAFYSTVPGTNVKVFGGEARYAILPGSTVSPALALRGSWVKVTGIDSFDLESKAVDLSLSKGFAVVTPYVGVGYVWGTADPDASTGLKKAEVNKTKAYLGVRFSLGLFELTPEVGQIGDNVAYNLRAGFSFSL
jgi:hypothetical protein